MRKAVAAGVLMVAVIALVSTAGAQGRGERLGTRLTQTAAIEGIEPIGRATYREGAAGPRNLVVRVGRVNLPAGTAVQVNACDGTVGWITLRTGKQGTYTGGRLRLRVRSGDAVPTCNAGDAVTVIGSAVDLRGALRPGPGRP